MKKTAWFLVIFVFLYGCAYRAKFVDFSDGTTIIGRYHRVLSHSMTVTMPDGEVFSGKYSALTNSSIGVGSVFYGGQIGNMTATGTGMASSMNIGGGGNGYAVLMGDRGTVMEIIFSHGNFWASSYIFGDAYGIARTNKGKEYKVIF